LDNITKSGKRKKILIVEDEQALRHAMVLKLSQTNFEIDSAADGREGMDKIIANHYDFILLDLILPKMDGFEILQQMQQKGIKSNVVVLSNLSQEEDVIKVKKYGARDYFIKSNIQLSDLVTYINTALLHENKKE